LFTFEIAVLVSATLAAAGIAIDVALALGLPSNELAMAALAQTLILIGGNFGLGGSLAAIMNERL
jgi:hypothetical protein